MFKILVHSVSESSKNILRSFWISATAITVLTISLGSVAFAISLSNLVGFSVRQLDKQVSIPVYIREGVSEEAVINLKKDIEENVARVKRVDYISDQEAKKNLIEDSPSLGLDNTFEEIYIELTQLHVFVENPESYNMVYDALKSDRYSGDIESVEGDKDIIARLNQLHYSTSIIGFIVVLTFSLISVLTIVNILRITVYNHKNEIEIMRLVGATNSYIRSPFVAEGTLFMLICSLAMIILFIPLVNIAMPQLRSFFGVSDNEVLELYSSIYLSLFATVFGGVVIGATTSYFATQKYLEL
jgi:cell division transport system permease protein